MRTARTPATLRLPFGVIRASAVILTATMTACASVGSPSAYGDMSGNGAGVGRGGSWAPLTAAELRGSDDRNLYDAVFRNRPRFLAARDVRSTSPDGALLSVYLDDQRLGGLAELRDLSPSGVMSVRFLTGVEAAIEFGPRVGGPVILVSTRR